MAASNMTSMQHIFKRQYADKTVANLAVRRHPFMATLRKKSGAWGESFRYAMDYGQPQGVSAEYAAARAAVSSSAGDQFSVDPVKKYGIITISGEAIARSEGNNAAFYKIVTKETSGIINEVGDSIAFDLQGAGNGDRGQRTAAATNVITLSSSNDVRNFKKNMTVVAGPNQDGTSLRTGTAVVTGVNAASSQITLGSAAGITGFADSDYLFRSGDPGNVCDGMESLFPLTAPGLSDSFRGVNRSSDAEALSGVRLSDTGSTIEENAGRVAIMIHSNGQMANSLWINPLNFWKIARRRNAEVMTTFTDRSAKYGFQTIDIVTPGGTLKCYSDPDCRLNRGRVLNMDTLYMKHMYDLVHVIRDDGKVSLRQTDADGIECRVRSFHNPVCDSGGSNGTFEIASAG